MKSIAALAAFAAGALAVPYKREMITDYDIVIVTDVVTVTAGEPVATSAGTAVATTTAVSVASSTHWPSFYNGQQHDAVVAPTATTSSSSYVAPAPTVTSASTSSSTSSSSSSSSSVYIAPTTAAPTAWTSAWTSVITEAASAASSYEALVPSAVSVEAVSTAQAAPASSVVSAASSAAASALPTTYSEITVQAHNLHRSNHSSQPLEWDDDLASSAQTVAESCNYAHNTNVDGGGYGQNIAAGVGSNNISSIITDLFYNGEVGWFDGLYGQAQPDMTNFAHWGHFSQIVWNATTHVGCYTQYCSGGLSNVGSDVDPYFTVCNYKSAGNFANEYGDNIGSPVGLPTAQWNTGL